MAEHPVNAPSILDVPARIMTLLNQAALVPQQVSDIHLTEGHPPAVRYLGNLVPTRDASLTREELNSITWWLSNGTTIADELTHPLDCSATWETPDHVQTRLRASVYPHIEGVAIALRILPRQIPTPEQLQLPGTLRQIVDDFYGIFLVAGPTGSGKSTTLASLLQLIADSSPCHIMTAEDPIEYILPTDRQALVHQVQITPDAPFAGVLRYILRQDPDVILIGEMRDAESMAVALSAAETGHLVLSTIHTHSAAAAITRIVDSFPGERQGEIQSRLAMSLKGVVFQRLLPASSGDARVPICEIMLPDDGMRAMIRQGKIAQVSNAISISSAQGMISFDRALAQAVRSGQVDQEVALRYARDAEAFASYCLADSDLVA